MMYPDSVAPHPALLCISFYNVPIVVPALCITVAAIHVVSASISSTVTDIAILATV